MPTGATSPSGRGRIIAFVAIVAVCVLGGGTVRGHRGAWRRRLPTSEARVARAVADAPSSIKESALVQAADPEDPGLDGSVAIARRNGRAPTPDRAGVLACIWREDAASA